MAWGKNELLIAAVRHFMVIKGCVRDRRDDVLNGHFRRGCPDLLK